MNEFMIIKYFKYFIILVVGLFVDGLGGYDVFLKTLLLLTVLDFITGILGGIYQKNLSSNYGFRGIIRKVTIYLFVALAVAVQNFIGGEIPLREIVISFYVINESLSILENGGKIIPYPPRLKEVLEQLKEEKV